MLHEFPRIAQLMLFPTRLSADYSPNDVIISNGIGFDELPGILIVLCTVTLAFALRRRAPTASFGLFWFIIAYGPVSNILVATGIVTAERTLFLPSVGVVLVAAVTILYLLEGAARPRRVALASVTGLLLVLGLGKSISRQRVWKNNDILFDATVRDAPMSYRAHLLRGRNLAVKKRLREAEAELRYAIRLFPYDAGATVDVAEAYRRSGLCKPALPLYEWSFAIDSTLRDGRLGYVYCLSVMERWQDTREQAFAGMRYGFPWEGKYLRNAVFVAASALGRPLRQRPPRGTSWALANCPGPCRLLQRRRVPTGGGIPQGVQRQRVTPSVRRGPHVALVTTGCRLHRYSRPTARDVAPSSSTIRRESHHEEHAQGLYTDRASDRPRDHRYPGRDRDPEVRQHPVEGVHRGDEVGSSQPRDGRGVVLLGFGEVCDGHHEGHEVQAVDRCLDADDLDVLGRLARDEHAQPAGELLVRYRREHDQPARHDGGRRRAGLQVTHV